MVVIFWVFWGDDYYQKIWDFWGYNSEWDYQKKSTPLTMISARVWGIFFSSGKYD